MKSRAWFSSSVLLFLVCGSTLLAQNVSTNVFKGQGETNGYTFTVLESEIAKTPAWAEGESNPPYQARSAIEAARKSLAELEADAKEWKLTHLSLHQWQEGTHWFWVVHFQGD